MSLEIPIAEEIREQFLAVNEDKLLKHIAEEQTKLLHSKYEFEINEKKRLTNSLIQFEKFKNEEAIKFQKKSIESEEKRKEAQWRIQNPTAARERDLIEERKHRNEIEKIKNENKIKYKIISYVLIGSGVGLYISTSFL